MPTCSCGNDTTKKHFVEFGCCAKCKTKKKMSIPKALKEAVWRKYFNDKIDGDCYICSRTISITAHDCGHIIPESKGGETNLANLRPVCKTCNTSMATKHMDDFKQMFMKFEDMEIEYEKKVDDPKYTRMWDEVDSAIDKFYNGKYSDIEKQMTEDDPLLWIRWITIFRIYYTIIDLSLHDCNHELLQDQFTLAFKGILGTYHSLNEAIYNSGIDEKVISYITIIRFDPELKAWNKRIEKSATKLDERGKQREIMGFIKNKHLDNQNL